VLISTRRGRPVAMLKSLEDDSHVKTRVGQFRALSNGKGFDVAKELVLSKMKGENFVFAKYGLELHDPELADSIERVRSDSLVKARKKLIAIEAKFTRRYFKEVFQLLPEKLRPERRMGFKAYGGMNNTFNLAYEVLSWKVHRALIKAKLEPYLGFLHSVQYGKPSLVCDFMEIYRYLIDEFVIGFCQSLKVCDFTVKSEDVSRKRKRKREYLNRAKTKELMNGLYDLSESRVDVPRLKHGKSQSVETLINEEAWLLAKFLRGEQKKMATTCCRSIFMIITILIGAVSCVAGLAFAFYDSEPLYLKDMTCYHWYEIHQLLAYFSKAFLILLFLIIPHIVVQGLFKLR